MIQNKQKSNTHRFGNILVSIEQDNLVRLQDVDAIVNAANVYLCSGGGVCGAIFDACGEEELTKECKKYFKKLSDRSNKKINQIETGECAVTDSCRLKENKIQFIFHSPGPIYDNHEEKRSIDELKLTIQNILKEAKSQDINSVAIPAISSGIYGFPKLLCAKIFLEVLRSNNQEKELKVRLVNRDTETFEIFRDVFNEQKEIIFNFDQNSKGYSLLVVPVLLDYHKQEDGQLILKIDISNSILNNQVQEDQLNHQFQQEIEKQNQEYYILQLKIEDHPKYIVVGFKNHQEQEDKQVINIEEQLFNLFETIFKSVKMEQKTIIKIPLIQLASKIIKKEKINDKDKIMIHKQLQNAYCVAKDKHKLELDSQYINIIADKETLELLKDCHPKF